MTANEVKQRIVAVLNAMDGVAIVGAKNRQIISGCETILAEIASAEITLDVEE